MSQTPPPDATPVNVPHVIRLRRPWLCELVPDPGPEGAVYSRRFGAPGNLATDERVELVVASVGGLEGLCLNGRHLRADLSAECIRVDVTEVLVARNEIRLTVRFDQPYDPETAEAWQERGGVRLEIWQHPS